VKWLKQRARAQRWREEILLVEEEMRRSLIFCLWRARWWMARASGASNHSGKPTYFIEGLVAYAMEQKESEEQRAIDWATKWGAIRDRAKVVLQGHLSKDDHNTGSLPELRVELVAEDDREVEEGADND
jgi:hypothetical protein